MFDWEDPSYTPADAEIIRYKVKKLIGRHGYLSKYEDEDDLQQDLAFHTSRRSGKYDPRRGARPTFVDRISTRKIAHIVERRCAKKRGNGRAEASLAAADRVQEKSNSAVAAEIGVDVRTAVALLPAALRDIAFLLGIYSFTEVMAQLGLTRGQLRERQKAIREHFENYGLNPNPNNQLKRKPGTKQLRR